MVLKLCKYEVVSIQNKGLPKMSLKIQQPFFFSLNLDVHAYRYI